VKFSNSDRNSSKDILFQALNLGVVLKSADINGNVMTRAMIKKSYFVEESYEVRPPSNLEVEQDSTAPLVQFNLPPTTLKAIVDMVSSDETQLEFEYPVGDSQLQVLIKEKFTGVPEMTTKVMFDTYEVSQTVKDDYSVTAANSVGSVYGKLSNFKKSLKEL
jgi:hypothetical protein